MLGEVQSGPTRGQAKDLLCPWSGLHRLEVQARLSIRNLVSQFQLPLGECAPVINVPISLTEVYLVRRSKY